METSGNSGHRRYTFGQVGDVEAAMQRRQRPVGDVLEKGKVNEVDVEMEDIELVGTLADLVQQREMCRNVGFERGGI